MLTHKVFFRKTRRNKILKVVREHYLRDDLICGSAACDECPSKCAEGAKSSFPLSPDPKSLCPGLVPDAHYLVVDTNVVLHNIDVLEVNEGGLKDVIVLQTVLEEVRHRSSPIYKRLCDLLADSRRRFFVFINEHHKETYAGEKQSGESANDRNDRAIRTAAAWFGSKHLKGKMKIVLLSDDVECRRKAAESEALTVFSTAHYVKAIRENPALAEKLRFSDDNDEGGKEKKSQKFLFPEHLDLVRINDGIKAKKLLRGVFYLSRTNFLEATVTTHGGDKPVLVQGLEHQNRAVSKASLPFNFMHYALIIAD